MLFFFNDTATTEIYTLSLHDALPILHGSIETDPIASARRRRKNMTITAWPRSEEHTSELQSQSNLVCRLLLENKKSSDFRPLSSAFSSACLCPIFPPMTTCTESAA